MKICTLNTWNTNEPLASRLDSASAFFRYWQPDVIALQEVSPMPSGELTCSYLARESGYSHSHYVKCGYWDGREEGLAIVTSLPVIEAHSFGLPQGQGDTNRRLQAIILSIHGQPIILLNTHLAYHASAGELRMSQIEVIVEKVNWLRNKAKASILLCGDLNDIPQSQPVQALLASTNLCDTWTTIHTKEGYSFSAQNPYVSAELWPNRRIDYVLCERPCQVRRAFLSLRLDDDFGLASDHYCMCAELEPNGLI